VESGIADLAESFQVADQGPDITSGDIVRRAVECSALRAVSRARMVSISAFRAMKAVRHRCCLRVGASRWLRSTAARIGVGHGSLAGQMHAPLAAGEQLPRATYDRCGFIIYPLLHSPGGSQPGSGILKTAC